LICLLLLGDGLLLRKLRLRLRVRLGLLRQVALLSGCLRVRSRLRSLLSRRLRLLLCPLDQPAKTFRLLTDPTTKLSAIAITPRAGANFP
jgi:hypothetical protein